MIGHANHATCRQRTNHEGDIPIKPGTTYMMVVVSERGGGRWKGPFVEKTHTYIYVVHGAHVVTVEEGSKKLTYVLPITQ